MAIRTTREYYAVDCSPQEVRNLGDWALLAGRAASMRGIRFFAVIPTLVFKNFGINQSMPHKIDDKPDDLVIVRLITIKRYGFHRDTPRQGVPEFIA